LVSRPRRPHRPLQQGSGVGGPPRGVRARLRAYRELDRRTRRSRRDPAAGL